MTESLIAGEAGYVSGESSFLAGLRPQDALGLPLDRTLQVLRERLGSVVDTALSPEAVDLTRPLSDLPVGVRSPRSLEADSSWLKRSNMVGINVRTVGNYAGVIKYALTLPAAWDSLHLLPIWEPGVVESLYGIASWNLNTEFFSEELYAIAPQLDTTERQLRAVSNLVHAMGKTIGMDVIPHTDRFSEVAVGNPDLFEWMRVIDREIVDHSNDLARVVEDTIFDWLSQNGSALPAHEIPEDSGELFALPEGDRLAVLFGSTGDLFGRIERRVALITELKSKGLEPVPATMGVPFRGIQVDPDPSHTVLDEYGMSWPDYVITDPQPLSRVFSPLARFKLYDRLDENANWEIDFSRPREHVWEYISEHYAWTRHIGNFDFMRGDMSHVQMRPEGVPETVDEHYDILGSVKNHIQTNGNAPWFGYFAETFLPPRDVFQFGEELDHLEASLADATLGDMQSTVVGSRQFILRFRRYIDDLVTRTCAPAFTVGTADKDDPRFDEFYRAGNEARFFTALFLPDMPTYVGTGYEIRDVHWEPIDNERYTKLFVFREHGDSNRYPSKARFGDKFIWGENDNLFLRLTRLRQYADRVLATIEGSSTRWLIPPDAVGERGVAAWTQQGDERADQLVFVVNYNLDSGSGYFGLPGIPVDRELVCEFSTDEQVADSDGLLRSNGFFHRIEDVSPGEGRVYRVRTVSTDS